MQIAKILKNILGAERAGRVAHKLQMLIVFFTSGETFAQIVTMMSQLSPTTSCVVTTTGAETPLRCGRPRKIVCHIMDQIITYLKDSNNPDVIARVHARKDGHKALHPVRQQDNV